MSADELYESDLRCQLGTALDEIAPPAPPTMAIKRAGHAIRIRRRVTVVAALALAVAAAAAVPGLAHGRGPATPVAPQHDKPARITVGRPGGISSPGLIAKGTIGGRPWHIVVGQAAGGALCVTPSGDVSTIGCETASAYKGTWPVTLVGTGGSGRTAMYGIVASKVRQVSLTLSDGQVLDLPSVRVHRWRWIGVEIPSGLTVIKAVAYARTGVLATAVPFNGATGTVPQIEDWQRPGQVDPAEFTRIAAVGVSAGRQWSVTAYVGPWGRCLEVEVGDLSSGTACWSARTQQNGVIMSSGTTPGQGSAWIVGAVRPSVSHLEVVRTGGSTNRIPVVQIGSVRLYAIVIVSGPGIASWGAYDAAGRRLYGGSGPPAYRPSR